MQKRQDLKEMVKPCCWFGLFFFGLVFMYIVINIYFLVSVLEVTLSNSDAEIVTTDGYIRGGDFIALWPGLHLAVDGRAELAYDKDSIEVVQNELTGIESWADRRFLHPPIYLLLLFPLGKLSYFSALAVWLVVPLLGFLFVIWRMGIPWPLFLALPFSGAIVQNIAAGQNGSLSALLLACGLLTLERRPTVAAIFFGIMTFKPQLALLIAPTLAFGQRWRALVVMSVTVLVGIVMSVVAFGIEPWIVFFQNLIFAQEKLGQGHLPWHRMPSAFVAGRRAGLGTTSAQIFQGIIALGAFAGVAWAWRRPVCFHLKAALLVAAIPLATPWVHDYDLVILLIPIAWLILDNGREKMQIGEIIILLVLWMFPVVWIQELLPIERVPYGFVILLAFYGLIVRRIIRYS